jgi:ferredoxin
MKVIITSDCVNCGLCSDIAPEIFRANDELDIAEVIRNPMTAEEEGMAREAADSCPTNAIQITE